MTERTVDISTGGGVSVTLTTPGQGTVILTPGISESVYLTDGAGNNLTDGAGNYLISAAGVTAAHATTVEIN